MTDHKGRWSVLLSVIRRVLGGELRPFLGQIVESEDGRHGAYRYAGAAVDTLYRIDVEQFGVRVGGLVLLRVNAIDRACVDAGSIFGSNTRFSDYVCHWRFFPGTPIHNTGGGGNTCLLYTSPSPRDGLLSR